MPWMLVGEVRRIIPRPAGSEGARFQLQLLVEEKTKAGEVRESLHTIGVNDSDRFSDLVGKRIALECAPWARKDGGIGVSVSDGGAVALAPSFLDTRD